MNLSQLARCVCLYVPTLSIRSFNLIFLTHGRDVGRVYLGSGRVATWNSLNDGPAVSFSMYNTNLLLTSK